MGRESRVKDELRQRLRADNEGNRIRSITAKGEAVTLLAGDLRIVEHFQRWVQAMDQLQRDGPPDWMSPLTPIDRVNAAIERGEIDYLASVLQAMGVPWRWCADVLVKVSFPILRHNVEHPDDLQQLSVRTDWALGLPTGQPPPHDGQEIAENVRWWYRAKVKDPKDKILPMAKEYAKRENRDNDCRSVVQKGIMRAEILLSSRISG